MRMIPARAVTAVCLVLLSSLSMMGCQLGLGEQRPEEPIESGLAIDRSLTMGEVTVKLTELISTEDGVNIRHSHRASDPDVALYPVGQPEIVNADEPIARIGKTVAEGGNLSTTSFTWRKSAVGVPDVADVRMGSFVVSRPEVSGAGQIELGEDYRSRIEADKRNVGVPLKAEITLDGRHFRATEMLLTREPGSKEFAGFVLTIKPADDVASITELAPVGSTSVILTDDADSSYRWLGTKTLWKRSPESRTVVKQELKFAGAPPASGSRLNLNIEGVGEVVGPFVFKDVPLLAQEGQ